MALSLYNLLLTCLLFLNSLGVLNDKRVLAKCNE